MKLRGDRAPVQILASVSLIGLLAGCGPLGGSGPAPDLPAAPAQLSGPAADYPVVVGDSFVVDGITYKPEDTMNYDAVGMLAHDVGGGQEISGSHRTLPLPSYVEVTSLITGRTILARLERRGPMTGTSLIGLSGGAMAQLGGDEDTPVRVRRVNPPEVERSKLRFGQPASLRMDTPMSLVEILRRKLPQSTPVSAGPMASDGSGQMGGNDQAIMPPGNWETGPQAGQGDGAALPPVLQPLPNRITSVDPDPVAGPVANAGADPETEMPPIAKTNVGAIPAQAQTMPESHPPARPETAAPAASGALQAGFMVQVGAYSSQDNANRSAARVDGQINQSGALYRVRTGPFATRQEAEASLAKVHAAGYKDARIFKNN